MKRLLALIALTLAGCAPSLSQTMNPQVGVMTVQQANSRFGAPASQAKAADGSTTLVWTPKRYAVAPTRYVAPRGPTYGGSASGAHASAQEPRGQDRLTLLFDRGGTLRQWRYQHE